MATFSRTLGNRDLSVNRMKTLRERTSEVDTTEKATGWYGKVSKARRRGGRWEITRQTDVRYCQMLEDKLPWLREARS